MTKLTKTFAIICIALMLAFAFTACSYGPTTGSNSQVTLQGAESIQAQSQASVADTTASTTTSSSTVNSQTVKANPMSGLFTLAIPLLLLVVFYFFLIRPQKKKDKEAKNMRENLNIGDEITTIGGIVGKVVMIRDSDQLIIECGADKTKIRIMRWAVQQKNTISE